MTIKTLTAIALVFVWTLSTSAQEFASVSKSEGAETTLLKAQLVQVHTIWTPDTHCMRTDLVRYRDQWFCRFQDSNHLVGEKQISIIHSKDGLSWKSAAILSKAGLPCSRFTVKSNEHLMLFSSADSGDPNAKYRSIGWSSQDGFDWTAYEPAIEGDSLLSRMAWHADRWFGVAHGYKTRRGTSSLVTTKDGKTFETHVSDCPTGSYYEASIVFSQQGTAFCLLSMSRTVEQIKPHAQVGSAVSPYREWSWKQLDDWLVDPNMIALPDGRLVVAGRKYDPSTSLAFPMLSQITLWSLEPVSGKLTELLSLRSGTDLFTCGSPGLVWYDDHLWISYNSSHELDNSRSRTLIYLAKVKLTEAGGTDSRKRRK